MGQSTQSLAVGVETGGTTCAEENSNSPEIFLYKCSTLSKLTQFQLVMEHHLMGVFDSCAWRTTEKPYILEVVIIK